MKKDWGIVGLGWLGQHLARKLERQGQSFWGTHRAELDLEHQALPLFESGTLLLNTPPLLKLTPETFLERVQNAAADRVIFVSSTSVFGKGQGAVTEMSEARPDTSSGEWLLKTERRLAKHFGERLTIVRPGGLIGGQRHPVYHLAGKHNIADGNDRVNLVHREDLVGILLALPMGLPLVHAVTPHHPTRAEYYTAWAKRLHLPLPTFHPSGEGKRCVSSTCLTDIYAQWHCPQLDFL